MRNRQGFTLIEIMVAMTLTIFVMVILTQAFVQGLETFSGLKAIGDMEERLRTAGNLIRADLAQSHLEGGRRLSDSDILTLKPREGFFRIIQGGASNVDGLDADGLFSFNANNHALNFTNRQRGNQREKFYSALCRPTLLAAPTTFFGQPTDAVFQDPPGASNWYSSPWCEIAYFLVQTGTTVEPSKPGSPLGTPIYALYRCQFVVVPDNTGINIPTDGGKNAAGELVTVGTPFGGYESIACIPSPTDNTKLFFPSPADLIDPTKRTFGLRGNNMLGANLVLTDVLSFQVQALGTAGPGSDFADLPGLTYDSSTSAFQIIAIKITIRLWDAGAQLTRQVTIIQDL